MVCLETNRTLFCGSTAMDVINSIGRASGYYQLMADGEVFGMRFKRFHTSRGTWDLVEHPLLNQHPTTRRMAIIADLQVSTSCGCVLPNTRTLLSMALTRCRVFTL